MKDGYYRPYGWRAKIGLIVPTTNTVNEAEWARMAPEGVSIHVTRMVLHTGSGGTDSAAALDRDIAAAIATLTPASVDVIAYGCTAGSMVSPLDKLPARMRELGGVPAVATAPAIVHALRALGARKIALATPYHDALNNHEIAFLAEHGIETLSASGLGIGGGGVHEYVNIARVPEETVLEHVRAADHPEADAMLVSCTDFATLNILPQLERELGKPVVSSNLATWWQALRTAGIDDHFADMGRLLQAH
ncbi:MAG: aspartate/glutamate racemase family protein [Proteobacteria bacterium]|nr:aspartate/glutamate racemase family protein [Pseudomonadota bacterium]